MKLYPLKFEIPTALGLFLFHLLFIQNQAGAVVYASIFNSIPKIEIEILTELLVHVKSSQKESDFALSALEMATKNKLKAHIIYLKWHRILAS